MKVDQRTAVAVIAGVALNQLLGPHVEHLRGLVDSLVLAELIVRAIWLEHKES